MTVLPELTSADTCPVCDHNHDALDEFWACPKHGHALQYAGLACSSSGAPTGNERFSCPAHRCAYERTAPPKPRSPSKGDPMTTVATRPSKAVDAMWARQPHLAAILPHHIDAKAFIGTAAAALYSNADLMKAAETSPDTLITALMRCAALGHQPGTEEFYLTPRTVKGRPTILGIEGYRGIVERMYRSGAVASVVVREVCANDSFQYTEGADDKPVHSFGGYGKTGADFFGPGGSHDRGDMVGVYAYAVLTTGAVSRVVILNRPDVEAARDAGGYSANDPHSPWNRYDAGKDHPEFQGRSMWWKTAARRLEPWVPTSAEYRREQLRAAAQATAPAPPAWLPDPAEVNDITAAEVIGEPEAPKRQRRRQNGPADALRGAISDEFTRLGVEDSEERFVYVAELAGLPEDADPRAPIGDETLTRVLGQIQQCEDIARLSALISNGDAPG